MKFRSKIILIFGGVILTFFAMVIFLLTQKINKDLGVLKASEAKQNVSHAKDLFNQGVADASLRLSNWPHLDDVTSFIADGNQQFIDTNLQNLSFTVLKINFVLIADKDKNIVFKKYVDNAGNEHDFPDSLSVAIKSNDNKLLNFDKSSDSHAGVILTAGDPVVMALRPALSADGMIDSGGVVAFGYYLDKDWIGYFSQLTDAKINLDIYNGQDGSNIFSNNGGNDPLASFVSLDDVNDPGRVVGATGVSDIFGAPAFVLKSESNRQIYGHMRMMRNVFFAILVCLGVLSLLIVIFLLQRFVFKPISKLSNGIQEMAKQKDTKFRLEVVGSDEFSILSKEINRMVDELNVSEERKMELESEAQKRADQLAIAKDKLEKIVMERTKELENSKANVENMVIIKTQELKSTINSLEKVNQMMINRELKMLELKKEIVKLKEKK